MRRWRLGVDGGGGGRRRRSRDGAETIRGGGGGGARAAGSAAPGAAGRILRRVGRPALPRDDAFRRRAPPLESGDEGEGGGGEKENEIAVVSSTRPVSESPHVFDRAVARSGLFETSSDAFVSSRVRFSLRRRPRDADVLRRRLERRRADASPRGCLRRGVGERGDRAARDGGVDDRPIGRSRSRRERRGGFVLARRSSIHVALGFSRRVRRRRQRRRRSSASPRPSRARVRLLGRVGGGVPRRNRRGGMARRRPRVHERHVPQRRRHRRRRPPIVRTGQWRALRDGDEIHSRTIESPKIRVGVGGEKMPSRTQPTQTAALRSGVRASPGRPPRMEDRGWWSLR